LRIAERELAIQGPLQIQVLRSDPQQVTDWVSRQRDLVAGLGRLEQRENGIDHLEQAVAAFQKGVDRLPRDKLPLDWADTQHNLSMALTRLGEQEEGTEYLVEALSAVNSALEVWTREDLPFLWAIGQNTVGCISIRLGERDATTPSYFEIAISACRGALEVQTEDELPRQRAITQNSLGNALAYLGRIKDDLSMLKESETVYSAVLKFYRSISAENDVQGVENNLRVVQGYIQGHSEMAG
jgi:tetratricopeptide (TPR) repeat protein